MPTRIDNLTPAQQERMASFAQEWIQYGWRTAPLTEEEWAVWEAGARRCYEYANIPWPGVVVRVPSPLVGAFAAPIASYVIAQLRRDAVDGAVRGAVHGAVDGAVHGAVGDAVGGAVRDAVDDAVRGAVHDAVGDAVDGAVHGAVDGAVRDAVRDAVDAAVDAAVHDAVDGAVRDAVHGAVRGAVRGAVDGAVDGAVGGAVDGAVGGAVDGAVDDAVRDAVRGAVDGAVRGAVNDAVRGAVGQTVRSLWYWRLGGRHWLSWWQSYVAYFRDVAELQLPGDLWDRSRAYEDAQSAGWWWPFRDFIMVCDVPNTLHLEQVGPTGWGSHRLHCENGPAVAWHGFSLYFWHGVRVPGELIEEGWSTDRILAEPNAEIRRCAIERLGWDQFIIDAQLAQVGPPVNDPGNPGHTLALYDVPRRIYDADVRVLLCDNATPERDGTRRRFGLTVPASISDPVAAAAWTFGLGPREYRAMERAS